MKYHWIILPIAITTVVAGCTIEQDDEDVIQNEDLEDVDSTTQSLPKGAGGINGDKDYCNTTTRCVSGEGDCDLLSGNLHGECVDGLICGQDIGPNFGFPQGWDVCVPSHCTNRTMDGGLGETGTDCGGPCGACLVACSGEPALDKTSKEFCSGCLCGQAQGDCDGDAQCNKASDFVCVNDVGPRFGYPPGWDICLKKHCRNGVQDAGETGVDIGGECSPASTTPALNVFFSEHVEGPSNNHHLEIYNAGSAAQNCTVNVYYSGAVTAGSTHVLNAAVDPGEFFVLCRAAGDPIAMALCDQTSSALQFNGDDAIELVCGGQTQDIIGQIGFDPGSRWGSGSVSTYDATLRRKCTVTTGDKVGSDAFVPSTEWDGFANGTYGNLGSSSCP